MAQIVAHVVLYHSTQTVKHIAIGHDRLDSETEVARVAVPYDVDPARVRGEQAADPGGPFGGKPQRKETFRRLGGGMRVRENHARLGCHHVVGAVDVTHPGQPFEREDHRHRPGFENLPSDEPCPPGIGDDPDTRLGAKTDRRRDGGGVGGTQNGGGVTAKSPPRLLEIAVLRHADRVRAERVGNTRQQRVVSVVQCRRGHVTSGVPAPRRSRRRLE